MTILMTAVSSVAASAGLLMPVGVVLVSGAAMLGIVSLLGSAGAKSAA